MASDEYPPYIPMPSLGHELGLMFGFLSLCIVVMGAYVALWRGELSSNFHLYLYIDTKIYKSDCGHIRQHAQTHSIP
jgi:hypothetical protein